MDLLSLRAMVQAWNLLRERVDRSVLKGCFKDGPVVICPGFGLRLLPFFILWLYRPFCLVVVQCSALGFPSLRFFPVRRSLLSKAFQYLFLDVPTFTALGVNDGALGIVVKTSFWIHCRSRCTMSIFGTQATLGPLLSLRLPCWLFLCLFVFLFLKPLVLSDFLAHLV
ncbi:hypothetical protein V6N13_082520 [Hibiscus sabdariffa]